MSRINTNVSSLLAQRVLSSNNRGLNTSLERLSTGLAINRGADDPAGLIASENLRSEKAAIGAAIGNAERADQVLNIAEGGLGEISALLVEVQGLVTEAANDSGLSADEKEANQLQVDSILQTIDRIAGSTSFQGVKLLNGTYDFTVASQAAEVAGYQVNASKLEHGDSRAVQLVVTQSAQHGGLVLDFIGEEVDLLDSDSRLTFEVTGAKGSREFSFASGTATSAVVAAINTFTSVTGVSALLSQEFGVFRDVVLKSTGYGSDQFVSVDVIDDGGSNADIYGLAAKDENVLGSLSSSVAGATSAVRDNGQDVEATINGQAATTGGKVARINSDYLDLSVELTDAGAGAEGTIDAFRITGGGASFNLGSEVNISNQVSVGIGNVAARNLGTVSLGFLDDLGSSKGLNLVDGDLAKAQQVVDRAISQVSDIRGRLGAFQKNVVGATIRALGVSLENTSSVESAIRDTDFASEAAELTRSQILVNAATNVLSIANSQPQSVLSLL